jgi:hypothetical protein
VWFADQWSNGKGRMARQDVLRQVTEGDVRRRNQIAEVRGQIAEVKTRIAEVKTRIAEVRLQTFPPLLCERN